MGIRSGTVLRTKPKDIRKTNVMGIVVKELMEKILADQCLGEL